MDNFKLKLTLVRIKKKIILTWVLKIYIVEQYKIIGKIVSYTFSFLQHTIGYILPYQTASLYPIIPYSFVYPSILYYLDLSYHSKMPLQILSYYTKWVHTKIPQCLSISYPNILYTRRSGYYGPILLAPAEGLGALRAPKALRALSGAFGPSSVEEGTKKT